VATRSSKCRACGARTTASAGFCQRCKSLRHHGYKQVKEENLVVDQAGGAWWIWDRRGDVLVAGKPTRDAAIIALGAGDVEDDGAEAEENAHATKKKSAAQLDAEIAEAIASRRSGARALHWEKRFTKAGDLVVGDVILSGSVPPYTAYEVLQIEPAPRRRIRLHLVRLPDREHHWQSVLRPADTVAVPATAERRG